LILAVVLAGLSQQAWVYSSIPANGCRPAPIHLAAGVAVLVRMAIVCQS